MTGTAERIAQVFREIAFLPRQAPVGLDDPLTDIAGWDSVSQVELVVRVEALFGFVLSESELRGCRTLRTLVGLVEARRGG